MSFHLSSTVMPPNTLLTSQSSKNVFWRIEAITNTWQYCEVQNYSVSGFIIFELFTVIFFQDWACWGIFTAILGNPRRTKGDSQHLEARPELQDWLRSELFTIKNYRTGPFSKYLGNNFELYSRLGPAKTCKLGLS